MNADSPQELTLTIRTDKTTYTTGDPVWLEINLNNIGSKVIKVAKYFMLPADDLNKNNLEFKVYDTAGKSIARISHILTGRALYYPEIRSVNPGESYRDTFQFAGFFKYQEGKKKIRRAVWNFGENPEITFINEYPLMIPGTFSIQAVYHLDIKHLISLSESEIAAIWKGKLLSNIIKITIK